MAKQDKACRSVTAYYSNDTTRACNACTVSRVGSVRPFHFRFGFGRFLIKNRSVGFPQFGFCMLTVTLISSLQPPGIDVVSPDAPRHQPAFTPLVVWCRMSWLETSGSQVAGPAMRMLLHTHSPPRLHVVLG